MRKYAREYVQKYPSIAKIYRPQNRRVLQNTALLKAKGNLLDAWTTAGASSKLGEYKFLMKT
jgi:hypothetical protein